MSTKTPALTASNDIRKYSSRYQQTIRWQKVRKRSLEIAYAKVDEEGLIELFQTDPDAARARWTELQNESREVAEQEIPKIQFGQEEKKKYFRARMLRGTARNWQRTGEEKYFDELEESASEVQDLITRDKETIAWLSQCIPTVATYTGVEGKKEFDDENASQVYGSISRGFQLFINKFQDIVEDTEDELVLYESDPIADIKDAIEALGLVEKEEYADVNDGSLWYEDSETGREYYFSLAKQATIRGGKPSVLHTYEIHNRYDWKNAWHVDLAQTAVGKGYSRHRNLSDIADDYFGAWDRLRPWIAKSVEAGNTPPTHFPSRLTTNN